MSMESDQKNDGQITEEQIVTPQDDSKSPPKASPSIIAISFSVFLSIGLIFSLSHIFDYDNAIFSGVVYGFICIALIWNFHDGRISEAETDITILEPNQVHEKREVLDNAMANLESSGSKVSFGCSLAFAIFILIGALANNHGIVGFMFAIISAFIINNLTNIFLKQLQANFYEYYNKNIDTLSYKPPEDDMVDDRYDFNDEVDKSEEGDILTEEDDEHKDFEKEHYDFADEIKQLDAELEEFNSEKQDEK